MKIRTVGDLREAIEGIPDNTKLVVYLQYDEGCFSIDFTGSVHSADWAIGKDDPLELHAGALIENEKQHWEGWEPGDKLEVLHRGEWIPAVLEELTPYSDEATGAVLRSPRFPSSKLVVDDLSEVRRAPESDDEEEEDS